MNNELRTTQSLNKYIAYLKSSIKRWNLKLSETTDENLIKNTERFLNKQKSCLDSAKKELDFKISERATQKSV